MTLRRSVIAISFIVSFITPFMGASVTIALPAIAARFGMNAMALNWINNAYLLATAALLLPLGRMADIVGRRRLLAYGIGLFAGSSLVVALAPASAWIFAGRALQGIGSAMIFSTSVALLTSVIEPGERGRMLGINTAAIYAGLSLGPILGGLATQHLGWRSLFYIPLPLAAAALYLVLRRISGEWAEARGQRFDYLGSGIYLISLVAVNLGITFLPALRALGIWLVAAGAAGILLFFRYESAAASPVLRTELLSRNRVFAFSNLAALVNYSATFAVGVLVSLYLQNVRGFTPQRAGMVMLAQPLVQALFSPVAGRLADRLPARIVASAGMLLCAAGLLGFVFLAPGTAIGLLAANLALLGLGFAFFSSPNTSAIMGAVQRRDYSVAASMMATMRMAGQMLSSALFALMIALFLGRARISPASAPAFMNTVRASFILFSVLCFAGVFASLARGDDSAKGGERAQG